MTMVDLLRPVPPADLIRMGRNYDGGYVFSSASLQRCDYFISCGLSYDWSFEIELKAQRPDMPIVAYDKTSGFNTTMLYWIFKNLGKVAAYPIRSLGVQDTPAESLGKISMMLRMNKIFSGNLKFVKKHIGVQNGNGVQSLGELLSGGKSYGVKLDVEGTEYELLDTLVDQLPGIELLLIEFHGVEEYAATIEPFLKAIRTTHYVQHVHGNNYDRVNRFGFLNSIELTIARKDASFTNATGKPPAYPIDGLDFPNDRRKPDFGFSFEK